MRRSFKDRPAPAPAESRNPLMAPVRWQPRGQAKPKTVEIPWGVVGDSAAVVAIVCDGPSAAPLKRLRFPDGVHVIAVNGAIDWLPDPPQSWYTGDASPVNRARMREQRDGVTYYAGVPDGYFTVNAASIERDVVFLRRIAGGRGLSDDPSVVHGGNSGVGALNLALLMGARQVVFFGLDGSPNTIRVSGGSSGALAYLGYMFEKTLPSLEGMGVLNASPDSRVTCFPCVSHEQGMETLRQAVDQQLEPRVRTVRAAVTVLGMNGMGDNLHQRGLIRHLTKTSKVWLRTPWPCLYHDLVGPNLQLLPPQTNLRTQQKNALREREEYSQTMPPTSARTLSVSYQPDSVRKQGSVLGAMVTRAGATLEQAGDFRLPVAKEWDLEAEQLLAQWKPTKPLLIYRPLVERTEWSGCPARNPDHAAYAALLRCIRDQFFVVSVADLQRGVEWMAGEDIQADVECHAGELSVPVLAALMKRAALVYCSPGFAVILAQAVGTPAVCVFGGYENSASFSAGARWAPYLGIDPIEPCQCFAHGHACKKAIDLPAARARLLSFVGSLQPEKAA